MPEPIDVLRATLADRDRIKRELGAGGMATVYLAQNIRHDRQVADALAYAHRQGVIHRNIKPENIVLRDGGAACHPRPVRVC